MKTFIKEVAPLLAIIAAVLLLCWLLAFNGLAMTKVFSPASEQIRRETFEQSKAYRQGAIQELQNMQFEYLKATPEQRPGLASIIRHRAADIPHDAIPADLYLFLKDLP